MPLAAAQLQSLAPILKTPQVDAGQETTMVQAVALSILAGQAGFGVPVVPPAAVPAEPAVLAPPLAVPAAPLLPPAEAPPLAVPAVAAPAVLGLVPAVPVVMPPTEGVPAALLVLPATGS
jgi:hypothetical protein